MKAIFSLEQHAAFYLRRGLVSCDMTVKGKRPAMRQLYPELLEDDTKIGNSIVYPNASQAV